jgi:hypothetical protein
VTPARDSAHDSGDEAADVAADDSAHEAADAGDVEARTAGLIDEKRLSVFMDEWDLPGMGEELTARFITGGASNELFEIRRGGHGYALRRPPRIVPAGRNETMLREYRLLAALADTDVPHARVVAVCEDPDMMGGCFYMMELVEGWSPLGGGGWQGPRVPARRRDREARQGRLEIPGSRGLRASRGFPRATGRPVDEPPGEG